MIPTKTRESRRAKSLKLPKNLERLYKEGKCRDCAVVVTRMDFAKILGKFTKVKIQYESSSSPKTKQNTEVTSPNSNTRLKSNENGMVLIRRNAYNQHPVKDIITSKRLKRNETPSHHVPNILRENNRLKKPLLKDKNSNYNNQKGKNASCIKQYGIVFEDPSVNNINNDSSCMITLTDLLPLIKESILPSTDWCIDYFPKSEEPKDDKVYDRIAAELEDLMYNEKPILKTDDKTDVADSKLEEFPSIMDILNDNSSENKPNNQNTSVEFKPNLESSDVEAMLLGKPNTPIDSVPATTPIEVDNPDMGHLIEDVAYQLNDIQSPANDAESDKKITPTVENDEMENPQSPSILDEALQKGIEEHLPGEPQPSVDLEHLVDTPSNSETKLEEHTAMEIDPKESTNTETIDTKDIIKEPDENCELKVKKENNGLASITGITHVVFKQIKNDACYKLVTCPKNLKYSVELDGKSVEFLGAPKSISSLEDLQVLLQIVNESEIDSLYVLQ